MGRLFGTDGARGIANESLTCEMAMQIGRAAAQVLIRQARRRPKMIIAQDTRLSSQMLVSALSAGICSVGVDVELLGELPTPAVAWLVGEYSADAGVMVSASHNPAEFNGIKLFSRTGYKLPDDVENEIERLILDAPEEIVLAAPNKLGRVYRRDSAMLDYIDHVVDTVEDDFTGISVALDCANGSAAQTAQTLFTQLGATVHVLHASPTGLNINENCGSTHMESLRKFMLDNHCDMAFAFDGDADRCLAFDENGEMIDGDQLMAIAAYDLKQRERLNENTLVATVMSNFGMQNFAREHDINLVCTSVGDRYVLEEMLKYGYVIGGEQSGHIIFKDYAQTGDGQLTAVQILSIFKRSGKKMSELASIMKRVPQVLKGVTARQDGKKLLASNQVIKQKIREIQDLLGDTGRVLVRASGTEPLIRVMVEGNDLAEIERYCDEVCAVIEAQQQ
ncbi:phosphoglucosamine mutase [Massiliimalia timonensis]|uniref:Phosphoglucosamine mutase n=1 Tax=Massiliimalia timonensis TaxID=1987501 RepID=A0A8J6PC99_9FIRM|nr:phosphoglucosamine mutase [Massiliimalia timonensis]MBC8609796.1 phosphoglucosamine mutase [Massiliimalia timonensis]